MANNPGPARRLLPTWAAPVAALAAVIVVSMGTFAGDQRSGPSGHEKARPVTYAAIGASDVVGIGAEDPVNEAWVARIYRRLPAGSRFVRLGVEGSTATQAAVEQLPAAQEAKADLVTVWLAVNDFMLNTPLDAYEQALEWIVSGSGDEKARLFLGNIPDLRSTPAFSDEPEEQLAARTDQWNRVIGAVAERNKAVLVDLFAASQVLSGEAAASLVADDGFHPSSFGYQVLAEIFWNAIAQDPVIGPVVAPG